MNNVRLIDCRTEVLLCLSVNSIILDGRIGSFG